VFFKLTGGLIHLTKLSPGGAPSGSAATNLSTSQQLRLTVTCYQNTQRSTNKSQPCIQELEEIHPYKILQSSKLQFMGKKWQNIPACLVSETGHLIYNIVVHTNIIDLAKFLYVFWTKHNSQLMYRVKIIVAC
jgi:hypothetical protein